MLIGLDGVGRQIGGRTLFRDASLVLRPGDRIGLVGPNGAGKTTLLRMIARDEPCDLGEISVGRGVRIGMLRQEIDPTLERSVCDEAASAMGRLDELEAELRQLELAMTRHGELDEEIPDALAHRYDQVSGEFTHGGGFEREARVAAVLAGLGFDEEARTRPLNSFSGGWLMRVELAKLFLFDPDVLLLDEPTNHLDLPAIQWFEETIDDFRGAVVVVSHDRTFLRRHVSRVAEVEGTGRFRVYEGNYDSYLRQREEQREILMARKANQDREIAQMERFVERFRAKSTKAKQAQSRVKALEKIERIEVAPELKRRMRMRIPDPERSGQIVMSLTDIHKSYDDKKVYEGVGLQIQRKDRVALAGPNGAGKSTLLRILAGTLDFDSGERRPGHNVEVAFYAQHQLESLNTANSILEELSEGVSVDDASRLRGHLGAFMFSGDEVDKKISVLSGGEKARVALAKMLLRPANLLIFDEPTNHLDITSREVLEQALSSFAGTFVFVSHDRSFINALATRVIDVDHGVLTEYLGNYDDYLAKRRLEESSKQAGSERVNEDVSSPREKSASASAPNVKKKGKANAKKKASANAKETGPAPSKRTKPDTSAPKLGKEERARQRERRKAHDRVKRRIGKLEETIQTQESLHESIGWKLGAPEIASDAAQLQELQSEREAVQTVINDLYGEWEKLSDELSALTDGLD